MRLWTVEKLDRDEARRIQNEFGLPPIVATLLQLRGITSREDIEDFLYNESYIAPPLEIKDMDKAAEKVRHAIDSEELICVYGDYDADGVTSTALLFSYLEAAGANAIYYIPSREGEGYGLNNAAIDSLYEKGVRLIVTVDNGIAASKQIAHASELGIDTVVTDHHQPVGALPEACAVVDLHRSDCKSRFKHLSGVGVAFKLIMALEGEYCDTDALLDNYSDLLSLGTIGDIVELKGENRVFVRRGLESIMNTDRPGIAALLDVSGLRDRELTAGKVSFTLVPRINAVGRLGQSGKSVELLLTEEAQAAEEIAQAMSDDNNERRQIENDIVNEIDARVRRDPSLTLDRVIVIDGEGWHQGVIGIVASRVREAYGKPVIVISRDGELAKASGRSVEGFALCDAVSACCDLLTHYGGHPMAVGLSLMSENIELFRKRINEYARSLGSMPCDRLRIDCKLNPANISTGLVDDLELLQPYGAGNPTPVFGFYGMRISNIIPLSNNKHLKLVLSRDKTELAALKFFTSAEEFPYKPGTVIDAAVTLDINVYNGNRSVSVIIKDIKPSADDPERMIKSLRAYECLCRGERLTASQAANITPNREDFAALYRFLRTNGGCFQPIETLVHRLGGRLSLGKIRVIIHAMRQLGLITLDEGMRSCAITLNQVSGKVSLESAPIIRKLSEAIA